MTKSTPAAVAITKERAPSTKISTDLGWRNLSACVEQPTVTPMRIVTISTSGPLAVLASLLVTPLSLRRLPKKSIPRSGIPDGTMNAVIRNPITGNIFFSPEVTARGAFILMSLSLCVVRSFIIGGWITGTKAI